MESDNPGCSGCRYSGHFSSSLPWGAEAVGMTMMISNVCTGLSAIAVAIPVVIRIRKMGNGPAEAA